MALLVGLSIALLTAYFGESASGGLHAIQRGFLEVLAPLQEGASRALKPARDLVGWTGDVFDAKSENEDLRKRERAAARAGSRRSQTAERDARQLRALVGFNRSAGFPDGYDHVGARVIGRSPTVWYSTITIDKGSDQGVRADQPVVSGDGLVGRVSDVSAGRRARDADHRPHQRVSRRSSCPDGPNGLVKATVGNPSDLILDFVQKGRAGAQGRDRGDVRAGAPRGSSRCSRAASRSARVTRVDSDERELYQRVHLRPFADLRELDVVEVLTARARGAVENAQVMP